MKLQKSTWAGIGIILASLAVLATSLAGGVEASSIYGGIADVIGYIGGPLGMYLVAADGGKPAV